MAADYIGKETAQYVRGTATDYIIECSTYCHQCGEDELVIRDGCHVFCLNCKSTSEGCGD